MTSHLALDRVVELNEGTKVILAESYQVSLRALDAVVKSTRGGAALRGFVEVSSQMRRWSRELDSAVQAVLTLSASQVEVMSALLRHERMLKLLSLAATDTPPGSGIRGARDQAYAQHVQLNTMMLRLRRKTTAALEELQQLGLMASVLSRAALIEAASGNAAESRDLSQVAREFAERADRVTETSSKLLADHAERVI